MGGTGGSDTHNQKAQVFASDFEATSRLLTGQIRNPRKVGQEAIKEWRCLALRPFDFSRMF